MDDLSVMFLAVGSGHRSGHQGEAKGERARAEQRADPDFGIDVFHNVCLFTFIVSDDGRPVGCFICFGQFALASTAYNREIRQTLHPLTAVWRFNQWRRIPGVAGYSHSPIIS